MGFYMRLWFHKRLLSLSFIIRRVFHKEFSYNYRIKHLCCKEVIVLSGHRVGNQRIIRLRLSITLTVVVLGISMVIYVVNDKLFKSLI